MRTIEITCGSKVTVFNDLEEAMDDLRQLLTKAKRGTAFLVEVTTTSAKEWREMPVTHSACKDK